MTSKPRLTYEFSLLYKQKQWFCRGRGYLGFGSTPKNAYYDWVSRVKLDVLDILHGRKHHDS